jgi:hypothetical protein
MCPLLIAGMPATHRPTRDTIERVHPPTAQRNMIQPLGTFVSDRATNLCFVTRDQSYQHNKIYTALWYPGNDDNNHSWTEICTVTQWPPAAMSATYHVHFLCATWAVISEQKYLTCPEGGPVSDDSALWNMSSAANRRISNKDTFTPENSVSLEEKARGGWGCSCAQLSTTPWSSPNLGIRRLGSRTGRFTPRARAALLTGQKDL